MASERVVLCAVTLPGINASLVEDYLDELSELVATAGGEVVQRFVQPRERLDPASYVGDGKAREIAAFCKEQDIHTVVFEGDLSPAQVRNLEKILERKVMDRTAVILDIFARRARSREAKTQVALAQYTYLLPRLTRAWSHLSRQAGGIGTRGIGETQLETDRRVIRRKIAQLSKTLEEISAHRNVQRRRRRETFEVALVGYTNVGKSLLLNRLASASARVEDKLFATLDTTYRRLPLEGVRQQVLVIDTVGFIRNLPHHLVASFRSTLEQAKEADLLLHVVNVSHPLFEEQAAASRSVLCELGLDAAPTLTVLNQIDRAQPGLIDRARGLYPEGFLVSALTSEGLPALKEAVAQQARLRAAGTELFIPYEKWPEFLLIRPSIRVLQESYGDEGVRVVIQAKPEIASRAAAMAVSKSPS
ncbi:MAG: GTPase HflX [Acidobacteria bacterium]|nr:GTPase HflX [Acidobacteriota bacterium]